MKIDPTENLLVGAWLSKGGRLVSDSVSQRIESLIAHHLVKVGRDKSGWYILYRDPDDGRLWEKSYPQSQLHGGGPPQLKAVSVEEARQRFGDLV